VNRPHAKAPRNGVTAPHAKGYEARGSVRGRCGHNHRTIGGAFSCAERDRKACAALGGGAYSDREVARVDGEGLSREEVATLQGLADVAWERRS